MQKRKVIELDVRPILATGVDPFEKIMETLKTVSEDETLLIINSFEPIPLLNKLGKQGYEYVVERPEDNIVLTYLQKIKGNTDTNDEQNNSAEAILSFEEAEKKFAGKMDEIDVRDLEMPLPMVTILEELEKLKEENVLFVHHKKLPQYLLPELTDRGYMYASKKIDDNNIKFIIFKK